MTARTLFLPAAVVEQSRSAFHPHVSVGTGYLRTDNPARAFGSILNQREFDVGLDRPLHVEEILVA